MKKNTISALFLSLLVFSLVSCSGSTSTTENPPDSTAIEATTEVATNSAFEKLISEFENCEDVESFLKGESCGVLQGIEGKDKIESLTAQILEVTGKSAGVKYFETEDALATAMTFSDSTATLSIHSLFKASWEDLVFLSFVIVEAHSSTQNQFSPVLVFTKNGEFKDAFVNYTLSSSIQVSNRNYISKVEKTEQSIKLLVDELEQAKGKNTTVTGAFYLIDKDGTVSFDSSQKK